MGVPGSGKGTISKKIVDEYQLFHLSTGNMLRKTIEEDQEISHQIADLINKGYLVSDKIVNEIVESNLGKEDVTKGFLTDGYPRTLEQALAFDEILKHLNYKIDLVINLVVNNDSLVERVSGRRLCSCCGAIYHIVNVPSKVAGICDHCGGTLQQRIDDTKEKILTRLNVHLDLTNPVLNYYRNEGLVVDIDANGNPDEVYSRVAKILEVYK